MRVGWSYCLGGIGLAAASLIIAFEVKIATARTETGSVSSTIDRSFKGDRLTPATQGDMRPAIAPTEQPKLPDGCESSASTIRSKPIIERCFVSAPAGTMLG